MNPVPTKACKTLKADAFGTIEVSNRPKKSISGDGKLEEVNQKQICRNTDTASWWAGSIARYLAGHEAQALKVLHYLPGIPKLYNWNGRQLRREWLAGKPMHAAAPPNPIYFKAALRLLRQMHRCNIAHNDLAKEANCLILDNGQPAFIDFQLALHAPRRGFIFRLLAREDLRHLLKHKHYYCAEYLTAHQRRILATPSLGAKLWMHGYKPLYLWFTRSILGWPERKGAEERVYKSPAD
ncbi:MAG: serine/threonine protein kinase [Gammaproteobacteria bacterium]|nr:serine/threonine protein kinase [Gammaproteobacteria bacterium]MCP4090070.1 serine/threonine protein kinase [Gammaproteobacteria bacterium]MCP4277040.1 serine/threonine protein kinase [Gammaproteobacteria bacterium]MCP4832737.1 serine/threonine protein kinase [Gammaproteobacteria bacterium]MCP4929930.1 serine/threonine protein kinase [Gammaproteobacteria bacterium]